MPTLTRSAGPTKYLAQNGYAVHAPRSSRPALLLGAILLLGLAVALILAGIANRQSLSTLIICILVALCFGGLSAACLLAFRNIASYLVLIGPGGIERHVGGKQVRVDYRELTAVRCSLIISDPPQGPGIPTPRKVHQSAVIRIVMAPRAPFGSEFDFMRTDDEPAPYTYKIKVLAPGSVQAARELANEIWRALYAYAPAICWPMEERVSTARRLT